MTAELTRSGGRLAGMSIETEVRLRRLARLRALEPRVRLAAELDAGWPSERPVNPMVDHGAGRTGASALETSAERAGRLARAIGGRVVSSPGGSAVIVERETHLPFDPGPLAALPYPLDPGRPLLLLDTETTGLGSGAGTLVFLVGIGAWDGETFRVTQLWLPDHADEPGFLDLLARHIPPDAWLVTYNGRSFDWPLVTTRYRLARRAPPPVSGHLDLLPIARQLFRHRLPDARLASVEAGVAGVRRSSDLPGALVPDRYFAWLRAGLGEPLRDVLEHNLQDVVSMALLLRLIATRLADPAGRHLAHPGDLAMLARAFRRDGRSDEALRCLEAALELPDPERDRFGGGNFDRGHAWLEQASLLATRGRAGEALAAWDDAIRCGGRTAVRAWIAVAKHHEHRSHDPRAALAAAEAAARLVGQRRALGRFDPLAERDLGRRLLRLRRRVARDRTFVEKGVGRAAGRISPPAPPVGAPYPTDQGAGTPPPARPPPAAGGSHPATAPRLRPGPPRRGWLRPRRPGDHAVAWPLGLPRTDSSKRRGPRASPSGTPA